jgi:hypothetical protein
MPWRSSLLKINFEGRAVRHTGGRLFLSSAIDIFIDVAYNEDIKRA